VCGICRFFRHFLKKHPENPEKMCEIRVTRLDFAAPPVHEPFRFRGNPAPGEHYNSI
jgi:hypothetical protein